MMEQELECDVEREQLTAAAVGQHRFAVPSVDAQDEGVTRGGLRGMTQLGVEGSGMMFVVDVDVTAAQFACDFHLVLTTDPAVEQPDRLHKLSHTADLDAFTGEVEVFDCRD